MIAIKSTIGSLKKSLEQEQRDIRIGEVNYINHVKESEPQANIDLLRPFFDKGISYKYENEVRAVIEFSEVILSNGVLKPRKLDGGYYATVNSNILIEAVYMSPLSPKWKKKLVESVLSKYGLIKKVRQSNLSKKPIF